MQELRNICPIKILKDVHDQRDEREIKVDGWTNVFGVLKNTAAKSAQLTGQIFKFFYLKIKCSIDWLYEGVTKARPIEAV